MFSFPLLTRTVAERLENANHTEAKLLLPTWFLAVQKSRSGSGKSGFLVLESAPTTPYNAAPLEAKPVALKVVAAGAAVFSPPDQSFHNCGYTCGRRTWSGGP
jgi:hypothetical protein